MNGVKLGLDIDSVIAEMLPVWIDMYNRDYGDNLQVADVVSWNLSEFTKPECGKKIFQYLERQDFYDHVPMIKGAYEGIKALQYTGYEIYYVSACLPKTMDQKMEWMRRNVPNFDWRQMIFTDSKHLMNVDALVDDAPHQLDSMPPWVSTVRFEHPYNKGIKANAHTATWNNILDTVKEALNTRQRYTKPGDIAYVQH